MSRHGIFGWDLPPGVTQRMIDEAYGGVDTSGEDEMDYQTLIFEDSNTAWDWLVQHEFLDLWGGFVFKDIDHNEARLTRNADKKWEIVVIPKE